MASVVLAISKVEPGNLREEMAENKSPKWDMPQRSDISLEGQEQKSRH